MGNTHPSKSWSVSSLAKGTVIRFYLRPAFVYRWHWRSGPTAFLIVYGTVKAQYVVARNLGYNGILYRCSRYTTCAQQSSIVASIKLLYWIW